LRVGRQECWHTLYPYWHVFVVGVHGPRGCRCGGGSGLVERREFERIGWNCSQKLGQYVKIGSECCGRESRVAGRHKSEEVGKEMNLLIYKCGLKCIGDVWKDMRKCGERNGLRE
jgi:hypothetical protein